MPAIYVVETESGGLYKIEDVSHLFGSDRWAIYEKGQGQGTKDAILWLGKMASRVGVLAAVKDVIGEGNVHIRILEDLIGNALKTRSAMGQQVFYTSENNFNQIIQWISHVGDPAKWNKISSYVSQTSRIVNVYRGM